MCVCARAHACVCDGCILCCAAKVTMSDNRPLRLIKGPSQRSSPSPRRPSSSSVLPHSPRRCSPPLLPTLPLTTPLSTPALPFFSILCGDLLVSTQLSLPPFLFGARHSLIRRAAARRPTLASRPQTQSHNDPDVRACWSWCGFFLLFNRGKTGMGN